MTTPEPITRRACLGAAGVTAASALAGCLDMIPFVGDDPLRFEAKPASVPTNVLEETGYEEHEIGEMTVTETFEAAGQSQDVEVTNWLSEYDRALDLGPLDVILEERVQAAVFTALSTPQVDVLGQTFNPVGDMSPREIADMLQDHYEDFEDLEQVDETEATLAGQTTDVAEFETRAELLPAGMTIDLTLHIAAAVESGDDFIIGIGGHPSVLDDEREHIYTLFAAVEHER